VRRPSRCLHFLGVQILIAASLHAGTITIENLEPDTVDVTLRQSGVVKVGGESFAAGQTRTITHANLTSGVDIEVRYTYEGTTRTAGTWAEGSSTGKIPSSRFKIKVINNTGAAVDPRIRRNGAQVNDWVDIAPGGTSETAAPGWSDFWFGGFGTYTVRNAYTGTDANPTAGFPTADYVQGFTAQPGLMVFTFGSGTYEVTRCIKNQYLSDVWGKWFRNGVQMHLVKIAPGQTVCKTFVETAGVPAAFAEFVEYWVTGTDENGALSSELLSQAAGTLAASTANIGTNNYNGPALPSGTTAGPIAQSNFVGSGSSAALGFTNVNLGGGASEGTSQAGFNGVISAVNAGADKITGAVITTGDKIVDALDGFGGGTNVVNVSVTNALTITNMGDTNLITRWDAWSNRGASIEAALFNATNYTTQAADAEATGVRATLDAMGLPGGLPIPSTPGGGPDSWTITVGNYTFNLDPVTHPLVGPLIVFIRGCIVYLMLGIYTVSVFKRLDEASHQTMTAMQTHVPNIQVMGNSVGWLSSPILLALVSTTLVSVPTALLALWQADSEVAAFSGGVGTLISVGSGPVGMALRLAWAVIPFETMFTLIGSWFLVMVQSRTIVWIASLIIRLIPA